MKKPDADIFLESPFFKGGQILEREAPHDNAKPLDELLAGNPFVALEIEPFAPDEFLEMESQETQYEGGPPKKTPPFHAEEGEAEVEEFNGETGGSIRVDFSLKGLAGGTLGNIPQAIRNDLLSGRERDLWTLTNRVFWDKHPALTNTSLNPKDRKQKTLIAEYGRMAREVKALLWLTQIVELLDKYRGDLPREFLLGWMAKESDGRVGVTTSLGERGYFQIHPAEFREVLKLKDKDFPRVSTDREFSIKQGIALVQTHRKNITTNYSVADPSELLWKLTKARHGLPGLLKSTLDRIVKEGDSIEWDTVAKRMRAAGDRGVSDNVEKTMKYASQLKALADLIGEPVATTPEVYAETRWLDDETSEIDTQENLDEALHEHDPGEDDEIETFDAELSFDDDEAPAAEAIEEEELREDNETETPEITHEAPAMAVAPTPRPGAGAGPDPCSARRSINEAQSLKEPFPRPCCALHPTLPLDQSLSVEDASPHFYGENRYPADEKNGFVYTCRGGFVDFGHARDWLDWTGYLAVHAKALLPAGGDLELTCEGDSSRIIQFKAQGDKRSDEICVYLAQRIAYQLSIWHEILTALFGHKYTAFSPEDNYSNLAGTYMGRDALMTFRKKPFNEAAALAMKHWLKKLGAVSQSQTRAAFAAVKNVWWKDVGFTSLNDLLLKRHFDALGPVTPMLVPGMCPGKTALPLPVPTIVQTPRNPGVMVKTDLRKLYVLKLGIGPLTAAKLAGTAWAGSSHVTPDEFAGLIAHVKTVL